MEPRPILWLLPFSVTERTLPTGSAVARRAPDALARLIARTGKVDARWAALMLPIEEGEAFAVLLGTADDVDHREHLAFLGGEYLFYGQMDLHREDVWLDGRLFSASHKEILIYPGFQGSAAEFLAWLPVLAFDHLLAAMGVSLSSAEQQRIRTGLTLDWPAFCAYCDVLDILSPGPSPPDWQRRALDAIHRALERDPEFEEAALLGLEVAERAWAESGLERAWEIVEALAARAGDLAPVAAYRARLLARLGRHTEARREAARADILKQRRLPPNA